MADTFSTLELFDVEGKTAVVTGAGSGIGYSIAAFFCRNGANVVMADIDEKGLLQAKEIFSDYSGKMEIFLCDMSQEEQIEKLRDFVLEKFDKIDILINSHGISCRASADNITSGQFDKVINVNLRGVFLPTALIGRVMAEQETGGSIINVSSIAAHVCLPNNVNYAAAKGGVEAMTRSFAGEWASRKVRVNAVAPGPCRTKFTEKLYAQPGYLDNLLKKIPRGEISVPADLMGPILLLATRAGANITGQTLIVDGGFTTV